MVSADKWIGIAFGEYRITVVNIDLCGLIELQLHNLKVPGVSYNIHRPVIIHKKLSVISLEKHLTGSCPIGIFPRPQEVVRHTDKGIRSNAIHQIILLCIRIVFDTGSPYTQGPGIVRP